MASEGALVSDFVAFIDVFADLHGSRSKSIIATTLKTSLHVSASTVTANAWVTVTFVVIDALHFGLVQYVSHWTVASEGTVSVDAFASVTNVGHELALVQVSSTVFPAWSFRTQLLEFLCIKEQSQYDYTVFVRVIPEFMGGHLSQ